MWAPSKQLNATQGMSTARRVAAGAPHRLRAAALPTTQSEPQQQQQHDRAQLHQQQQQHTTEPSGLASVTRRAALGLVAGAAAVTAAGPQQSAWAVQGLTAGRIPGVSTEPDKEGFYLYQRPEGKSGGWVGGWVGGSWYVFCAFRRRHRGSHAQRPSQPPSKSAPEQTYAHTQPLCAPMHSPPVRRRRPRCRLE